MTTSTLTEDSEYTDDGCRESPRCLECPLPACKYDGGDVDESKRGGAAQWVRTWQFRSRDIELAAYYQSLSGRSGQKNTKVGARYGINHRSVERIMAEYHSGKLLPIAPPDIGMPDSRYKLTTVDTIRLTVSSGR